jgi:hypothetical protein
MKRVAGCFAARADEPRPDPTLPKPNDRHRPLAENDLDPGAGRLNHDHAGGGPGKLRGEGVGN